MSIVYGRKEGNVLFNNAHNTFYLRLYGIRHMVKDNSDSERGNLLPSHRLFFLISSKGYFICITDRITHTTAFVTPVVEHWLEREIAIVYGSMYIPISNFFITIVINIKLLTLLQETKD